MGITIGMGDIDKTDVNRNRYTLQGACRPQVGDETRLYSQRLTWGPGHWLAERDHDLNQSVCHEAGIKHVKPRQRKSPTHRDSQVAAGVKKSQIMRLVEYRYVQLGTGV